MSLYATIPAAGFTREDDALDAFLGWVGGRDLTLYPAQEEAILELFGDAHVLLKTPTGSGKSLVAVALHFRELAAGRRSVYTAPIKALVSEKFLALCDTFGPENVGMMTGDGSVNRDASILCCTAEILAKMAVQDGDQTPFDAVVMDEFHFYGDRDRGMAWQLPLLTMDHARFLLMSATLGDTTRIEHDLAHRTGKEVAVVESVTRPVPLDFIYSRTPSASKLQSLVSGGHAPVYAVHFTQRAAAELAQSLLSTDVSSPEEKSHLKTVIKGFRFDSPYGKALRRLVLHGVGIHHAGMLPRYRMLVEKLAQQGLFKVICGTDTLGVGINVPIRTVFFTQLCKFDGVQTALLTVRHFKQISGRAGRKGFDDQGTVVAQAPAWVIENDRLADAVATGKKKKNKTVKKKAPTRGYKHWDEDTFARLQARAPADLKSRFRVDHGLVLSLLQKAGTRLTDGMAELDDLIERSHTGARAKARHREEAAARLAELIESGVVVDNGETALPRYSVNGSLQEDFSLHHSLSLFLIHGLSLLDPTSPNHAMNILTLVESILENPGVVLAGQVRRDRGQRIAELKAEGVPYEERMEILETITWPKPSAPWIYQTFNEWSEQRPWVQAENIRPKGIVREMIETQLSFSNYVKSLQIERSEGVLLRYIHQVYKTLVQNVPEPLLDESLIDAMDYLRALLARIDDSLLRSWEALFVSADATDEAPYDISKDLKSFRRRIRAELHAVHRALAVGDFEEAAASVKTDEERPFTASTFEKQLAAYLDEFGPLVHDGRVKLGWMTLIESQGPHRWRVRQLLDDSDENGWSIDAEVDLRNDTNPAGPLLLMMGIQD
jgi:superfamily II RNA helicase